MWEIILSEATLKSANVMRYEGFPGLGHFYISALNAVNE